MSSFGVIFFFGGKNMNENFDVFDEFVMSYDMNVDMIGYKYNHSYRTVHQAEEIARSLNLSEEDKELASFIALTHDVARFRQWTDFQTFDDHNSFDHGDEGVKILFDEGEIEKYNVSEEDYSIIKNAIKFHNKLLLDETGLSEREILHSKIIRDADKIDIIYSFSTQRLLEIESDDSEISDKVIESIKKHELINKVDVVTKNDRIIMELGLVYDLNFDYSIRKIYEENYLGKMVDSFSNKELFMPYLNEINEYMKGRIENAR
jgi:HD superfamily phosphohydrolase YqeK